MNFDILSQTAVYQNEAVPDVVLDTGPEYGWTESWFDLDVEPIEQDSSSLRVPQRSNSVH